MIPEDFRLILDELTRQPLSINRYRTCGDGRSQAFGIVGRRCLKPDYSRQCWRRPELYSQLLAFGKKHVPFPFTSITVNDDYKAAPHRDKGNIGESWLCAFGAYTGGELKIHEGDLSGTHDIRYKPFITDFSQVTHSVSDWIGHRYSLVFYTAKDAEGLPSGSIRIIDGRHVFYRGEEAITEGLPHPLRGRKKKALV